MFPLFFHFYTVSVTKNTPFLKSEHKFHENVCKIFFKLNKEIKSPKFQNSTDKNIVCNKNTKISHIKHRLNVRDRLIFAISFLNEYRKFFATIK